jgi:AAA+ superfamily predicted ATPase
MELQQQLQKWLEAGTAVLGLLVPLSERNTALGAIARSGQHKSLPTYSLEGMQFRLVNPDGSWGANVNVNSGTFDCPLRVFDFLFDAPDGIYVIDNFQSLILDAAADWHSRERTWALISRILTVRDRFAALPGKRYLILLSSLEKKLPTDLARAIPQLQFTLPDLTKIGQFLHEFLPTQLSEVELGRIDVEAIAQNSRSLSLEEIKEGLRLWQGRVFGNFTLGEAMQQYRRQKLSESGIVLQPPRHLNDFGGLDNLKRATEQVKFGFSSAAQRYGLAKPKGWLLVGPPGTGKTHAAAVCAHRLGFELALVDTGSLVSAGVSYLQRLLRRVDACGSVVLYFDEFDKLFAGSQPGSSLENAEILGVLLTWLQDKQSDVFTIATLNRLRVLPPELTRAGRFDRIFYVGFPTAMERWHICKLHAARFDSRYVGEHDPLTMEEKQRWVDETLNCTGAEITHIVQQAAIARAAALVESDSDAPIELQLEDLLAQRRQLTPLYVRDCDRILAMENSVRGIAEPASIEDNSCFAPALTTFWGEPMESGVG